MPRRKTIFQNVWITRPEYAEWLDKSTKSKTQAFCKLCKKHFDIGNMGKGGLDSHAEGGTHKTLLKNHLKSKSYNLKTMFASESGELSKPKDPSSANGLKPPVVIDNLTAKGDDSTTKNSTKTSPEQVTISNYIQSNDMMHMDLATVCKTIALNQSFVSNDKIGDYFDLLLQKAPSAVTEYFKNFKCGAQKSKYLAEYALAPHFKSILEDKIKSGDGPSKYFVVLFDESLNDNLQKKQLDFHIRHWNTDGEIATRYFKSDFLGKACAVDLVDKFEVLDKEISLENLLQLSMDGPSVNILTHKKVSSEILIKKYKHDLLDIGSCGLHQVHNAFKDGLQKSGWDVASFLKGLHYLFHDAPARREEYLKANDLLNDVEANKYFGKSFSNTRWLENIEPAKRALKILPNIRRYVKKIESKRYKRGEYTIPTCASYLNIKKFVADPFAKTKLEFFVWFATPVEEFSTVYQTDEPMVPFLVSDINNMTKIISESILKPDIHTQYENKILSVDFDKATNCKDPGRFTFGFKVEKELNSLKNSEMVTKDQNNKFLEEAGVCVKVFLNKLKEKSPVLHKLAQHLRCLDPNKLINSSLDKKMLASFKKVVNLVCEANLFDEDKVDILVREFTKFQQDIKKNQIFAEFSRRKSIKESINPNRLDKLYYSYFHGQCHNSIHLWPFIAMLLLLSHGQASVERGFSINNNVVDVNQSEGSLQAKRIIKDHFRYIGGFKNVNIDRALINKGRTARMKYRQKLEKEKEELNKEMAKTSQSRKRKAMADE